MSEFMETLLETARSSGRGLNAGANSIFTRQTWAQIHDDARRISGALAEAGVGPGDAVAILAGHPAEVASTVQAIWMRGASATMLHQPSPRTKIEAWIQSTAAVLSMVSADAVVLGAPFESAQQSLSSAAVDVHTIADLRLGPSMDPISASEDDVALLQLTSGSTGIPKAVAITHSNLHHSGIAIKAGAQIDPRVDVGVSWLPLFHDMGMVGFLITPMQFGIEAVCTTPSEFLKSPLVWADLVTRYRGTMTAAPNFAFAVLAKRLENAPDGRYDLSSLRWVLNGAEPIDPNAVEMLLKAGARFGLSRTAITPAYGMAEATLAISLTPVDRGMRIDRVDPRMLESAHTATPSDHHDARPSVCLGPLLKGIESRIINGDGVIQKDVRAVGEIQIRGRSITTKYVTSEGVHNPTDGDGWLCTGDLGYFTEEGEIVVCGRKKDTIIIGGRNIFSTDIERAASQVTGVRAGNVAAVRLVDDQTMTERFAVVAESTGHDDTDETSRMQREISQTVFGVVGIRPHSIKVVQPGSLPKTTSGKLRRSEAAKLLC